VFSNSIHRMGGSIPPGGGFQIATNLVSDAFDSLPIFLIVTQDSAQASYIGEDGRFTLLRGKCCESITLNPADSREIYIMLRTMAAANSSGSSARIPQETLRLLPIISRTLIRQYFL
jgi:hypothetical protein